ncbi:MAG TPA: contact-dependent growth inhibition system immunity protein [Terriglobales bacterium]|nr:contact-dependent growth inhibition system immunity protein [Terriglobales bacterium]
MSDRKSSASVSKSDYPKFSEFLRGYLHQDAHEEYDTADEAAQEFLSDADSEERITLQNEVKKFQEWSTHQSLTSQNSALKSLGGYWSFANTADVDRFLKTLLGARPRHHEDEEDEL